MKRPLRSCARLLRGYVVEVLPIAVPRLEERLEIILLHFLANDQLQCLALQDLIGLLLRAQLDQESLIDALEGSHFRMLSRIVRMRCRFELADIGFSLSGIRVDRTDRLKATNVYG